MRHVGRQTANIYNTADKLTTSQQFISLLSFQSSRAESTQMNRTEEKRSEQEWQQRWRKCYHSAAVVVVVVVSLQQQQPFPPSTSIHSVIHSHSHSHSFIGSCSFVGSFVSEVAKHAALVRSTRKTEDNTHTHKISSPELLYNCMLESYTLYPCTQFYGAKKL